MKHQLDAKVKNVHTLLGTTIETVYRDGANLTLQIVKLVQQILGIWGFNREAADMTPVVLESIVSLQCILKSLGGLMDGPKQI